MDEFAKIVEGQAKVIVNFRESETIYYDWNKVTHKSLYVRLYELTFFLLIIKDICLVKRLFFHQSWGKLPFFNFVDK